MLKIIPCIYLSCIRFPCVFWKKKKLIVKSLNDFSKFNSSIFNKSKVHFMSVLSAIKKSSYSLLTYCR